MQSIENFTVICPLLKKTDLHFTSAFGCASWLLSQAEDKKSVSIGEVTERFLIPIMQDCYLLIFVEDKPIAFATISFLSTEAQIKYFTERDFLLKEEDWKSGQNPWIIDMVAPFGRVLQLRRFFSNNLFPKTIFRHIPERMLKRNFLCIDYIRGAEVSDIEFEHWVENNPINY